MNAANDSWGAKEDEEDEYETLLELNKDTILFCIDASASMQSTGSEMHSSNSKLSKKEKKQKQRSMFHQALQCALDVMKRKVIICPNDSVGILFFNTEEKEGDQVMNNHHLFLPVAPLSADPILSVMEVLDEAAENPESLKERFAPISNGNVPIGDVFASCNHALRAGAPKTSIKRIFYITNEDNPGSLVRPAGKRLEDLVAQGITLVPFFVSTEEKPFDVDLFYKDVLTVGGSDDDPYPFGDVCSGFEQVIAEMRIREMPKRAVWSIPMEISEGLTIGVKGYGLITEQRKPPYKQMSAEGDEMEEVISKAVYFDKELQTTITKEEILYGPEQAFEKNESGEAEHEKRKKVRKIEGMEDRKVPPKADDPKRKVLFTAEQVKAFRTLGLPPGIKILGFKDLSELTFEDNVKHAYFLYPDESKYTGSTRTFTALLRSLLRLNKMGICRVTMRSNSSPVFCAMMPQAEKLDEDGVQIDPPGFHLIPLPFADEIRPPPLTEAMRCSDDLVECATQLIKKLIIKKGYQPDSYPNPSLALHFAFIEANALNLEFDPDAVPDTTLPSYEKIHSKAGPLIESWREQLENEEGAQIVGKPSRKRAAADPSDAAFDEAEIRSRHEAGTLAKLTVSTMKDFLKHKSQKVSSSSKKADLMEQLSEYLENNPLKK